MRIIRILIIIAFILCSAYLVSTMKAEGSELSLTPDVAYAYLQELEEHEDEITIIGVDRREDINGNVYSFSDTAVSFYDLNGDGIAEMFYQYHTPEMYGTSCKILSYQNGELVSITNEDGEDLWISGAATGNYAVLFTIKGSDHLFMKTGTITGGVRYDNVSEYELIEDKLFLSNYYLIEKANREQQPWTYSIHGEDSTKETLEDLFHNMFSNLDKVLINKLNFYLWEPTISDQECISMTYEMAVEELSAFIPDEYLASLEQPTESIDENVTHVNIPSAEGNEAIAAAYEAYIPVLQDSRKTIIGTQWEELPIVTIWDITGDDIPELIFQEGYHPYEGSGINYIQLRIITYIDGQIINLYTRPGLECFAGGMGGYFFFQIENDPSLYYCQLQGGDYIEKDYYRLEKDNDKYEMNHLIMYFDNLYSPGDQYTLYGQPVEESSVLVEEAKIVGAMQTLLMTDPLRWPYQFDKDPQYIQDIEKKAMEMESLAMTYDETIAALRTTIQESQ